MNRRVLVLLLVSIVTCCACTSNNSESKDFKLQATTYQELPMQSILQPDNVTRIDISYEGKNYIISDSKELEMMLENWENATLINAEVTLLENGLPPGYLYSIKLIEEVGESINRRECIITVVRQEGNSVELSYMTSDKKEYKIVGELNYAYEMFLIACMETYSNPPN